MGDERLSGGRHFRLLLGLGCIGSVSDNKSPLHGLVCPVGCNDRFPFCTILLHFSSFCLFVGHLSASAGLFACGSLLVNWAYCPGMVIQHFDGLWKSPIARVDQAWVGVGGYHDDKDDMAMI